MSYENSLDGGALVHHNSELSLVDKVKSKQHIYLALMDVKESVLGKLNESFSLGGDGMLRYHGRLCVHDVDGLGYQILAEAHGSRNSIHPGLAKMYNDIRETYWWKGLKKDITELLLSVRISNK